VSHLGKNVVLVVSLFALGAFSGYLFLRPRIPAAREFSDGEDNVSVTRLREQMRLARWEAPERLGEEYLTGDSKSEPFVDDALGFLFFTDGREGGDTDLWMSQPDQGGPPRVRLLEELNTSFAEQSPCFAGGQLYFASNRPGGLGGLDLYRSRLVETGFLEPENLGPAVNSLRDETEPAIGARWSELLFASSRGPREVEDFDLYRAKLSDQGFAVAGRVESLSSAFDERSPSFDLSGTILVFASDRSGGRGGLDLFRSLRLDEERWLAPDNLGSPNSAFDESGPSFADGGFTLYFDRGDVSGMEDLFRVRTRELFPLPRPRFSLADLTILFLLALIALLAWLARRWETLEVIYKCLIISLLIHLLILWWSRRVDIDVEPQPMAPARPVYQVSLVRDLLARIAEQSNSERGDRVDAPRSPESDTSAPVRASSTPALAAVEPPERSALMQALGHDETPVPQRPEEGGHAPSFAERKEIAFPRTASESFEKVSAQAPGLSLEAPVAAGPSERRDEETGAERLASSSSRSADFRPSDPGGKLPRTSPADSERLDSDLGTIARSEEVAWSPQHPEKAVDVPMAVPSENIGSPRPETSDPLADSLVPGATSTVSLAEVAASDPSMVPGRMDTDGDGGSLSSEPPGVSPSSAFRAARAERSSDDREVVSFSARETTLKPAHGLGVVGDLAVGVPTDRATARKEEIAVDAVDEWTVGPASLAVPSDAELDGPGRAEMDSPSTADRSTLLLSSKAPRPLGLREARVVEVGPVRREQESLEPAGLEQPEAEKPNIALKTPLADVVARAPSRESGVGLTAVPKAVSPRPEADEGPGLSRLLFTDAASNRPTPAAGRPPLSIQKSDSPADLFATTRADVADTIPRFSNLYDRRFGAEKQRAIEEGGGSEETERAVLAGLRYLASVQKNAGFFGEANDCSQFDKYRDIRAGKTGLATLAFLGAGHTTVSETEFTPNVRRALGWILSEQDPESGHFGDSESYSHGIATYALAECYAMTKDAELRAPLELAVAHILDMQLKDSDHPELVGGWRYYYPGGPGYDDYPRASISSWQVMALESARIGGLEVPEVALEKARGYFKNSFDADHGYFRYTHNPEWLEGVRGYRTLPASNPASIFVLTLLGAPRDEALDEATQLVLDSRPSRFRYNGDDAFIRRGTGHLYYWYYATLAMFFRGAEDWTTWNEAMKRTLLPAQEQDGSWRPIDPYSTQYAGDDSRDRSYSTALCTLCLEIYYRYFTPLLQKKETSDGSSPR